MGQSIQEWTKYNLRETVFRKFKGMCSASTRPYPFKFSKGCLPQFLLDPL